MSTTATLARLVEDAKKGGTLRLAHDALTITFTFNADLGFGQVDSWHPRSAYGLGSFRILNGLAVIGGLHIEESEFVAFGLPPEVNSGVFKPVRDTTLSRSSYTAAELNSIMSPLLSELPELIRALVDANQPYFSPTVRYLEQLQRDLKENGSETFWVCQRRLQNSPATPGHNELLERAGFVCRESLKRRCWRFILPRMNGNLHHSPFGRQEIEYVGSQYKTVDPALPPFIGLTYPGRTKGGNAQCFFLHECLSPETLSVTAQQKAFEQLLPPRRVPSRLSSTKGGPQDFSSLGPGFWTELKTYYELLRFHFGGALPHQTALVQGWDRLQRADISHSINTLERFLSLHDGKDYTEHMRLWCS